MYYTFIYSQRCKVSIITIGLYDIVMVGETMALLHCVSSLMRDRQEWHGTPTQLFDKLCEYAAILHVDLEVYRWCQAPRFLGLELKKISTNFFNMGLKFIVDRSNGATTYHITSYDWR